MNESELEDLRGSSIDSSTDPQRPPIEIDSPLYAEDLSEGDIWETEYREISGNDVCQFASLTGDHTPIHDEKADSPFGKPIAHGLLGLSVLAGLGTNHPHAATLALVSIDDWKFLAPVFFGDRVQAKNEIVNIEPHGRRAVKVFWQRSLVNEAGRTVQQGQFVTLVARKSRANKPR
ncbi:monoamine oxidase [Stieleria sp. JC731]|uniref:MaoC family dehydratase n=1 Tax=Pirellulaceae TaxID=2691357 RepID=UPI001E5C2AF3|nr:MaoC/PaaZ C-terminal domain-containing protein [Stieleria sp. JC731]MCC9601656.1 monoamine oxidase [Stieleria sp. JC731]